MTRALAVFTVGLGRHRVRVRLLPSVHDVDAEFRAGKRRRDGTWTHAFFRPAAAGSRVVGTIALPGNGRLTELVPHESTHCVMHLRQSVHVVADEPLATDIGLLTARIFDGLRRRGYGL